MCILACIPNYVSPSPQKKAYLVTLTAPLLRSVEIFSGAIKIASQTGTPFKKASKFVEMSHEMHLCKGN